MRVVGLDLSLTSTGVAVIDGDQITTDRIRPRSTGHMRLSGVVGAVTVLCTGADLVVVEGPSYGSTVGQKGHHERAGLWWLVTHDLWAAGVPTAVVPPTTLKKYATGKGNADKDLVLTSVVRRFPQVPVVGNDVADAVILAAIGARYLGSPVDQMPAAHVAALAKVEWPEIPAEVA